MRSHRAPQRSDTKRGTGWKPPRDRREIVIAVLASLAVIVVTAALVWFLRPEPRLGTSTPATDVDDARPRCAGDDHDHAPPTDDHHRRRPHPRPRRPPTSTP